MFAMTDIFLMNEGFAEPDWPYLPASRTGKTGAWQA